MNLIFLPGIFSVKAHHKIRNQTIRLEIHKPMEFWNGPMLFWTTKLNLLLEKTVSISQLKIVS